MPRSTPFSSTRNRLLVDPELAAMYLEEALESGNMEEFTEALRHVAQAQGGVSEIAGKAGLHNKQLYRTLSRKGNPRLDTLSQVLHSMGLRLAVVPEARVS